MYIVVPSIEVEKIVPKTIRPTKRTTQRFSASGLDLRVLPVCSKSCGTAIPHGGSIGMEWVLDTFFTLLILFSLVLSFLTPMSLHTCDVISYKYSPDSQLICIPLLCKRPPSMLSLLTKCSILCIPRGWLSLKTRQQAWELYESHKPESSLTHIAWSLQQFRVQNIPHSHHLCFVSINIFVNSYPKRVTRFVCKSLPYTFIYFLLQ